VTLDAMMIAGMIGLKATGVYTTIIHLTGALQIPYRSMLRVSAPLVAEYWKERDMARIGALYKKFSSVNLVVALTVFLIVWTCRTEIFHFLPKEYESGIYVFLFLMVGRVTDMYLGLNGVIFVTSKKYRYDMFFTVFLIVIVFFLNLALIPLYGITGTAIATCVAYIGYNVGRMIFVYAAYKIHPFERKQLYIVLLFASVVCFFEWFPLNLSGDVAMIFIKWTLLGVVFLLPIYFFKIETEIVRYVDNGLLFVKKKLGKKGD
jgi:O-antigen/teichoic acid export membrane protein